MGKDGAQESAVGAGRVSAPTEMRISRAIRPSWPKSSAFSRPHA